MSARSYGGSSSRSCGCVFFIYQGIKWGGTRWELLHRRGAMPPVAGGPLEFRPSPAAGQRTQTTPGVWPSGMCVRGAAWISDPPVPLFGRQAHVRMVEAAAGGASFSWHPCSLRTQACWSCMVLQLSYHEHKAMPHRSTERATRYEQADSKVQRSRGARIKDTQLNSQRLRAARSVCVLPCCLISCLIRFAVAQHLLKNLCLESARCSSLPM
jgi:hypothetical protein